MPIFYGEMSLKFFCREDSRRMLLQLKNIKFSKLINIKKILYLDLIFTTKHL
jgi:hypothetical protein